MALLAGAICGVRNDSCSRKHTFARTSHGMASKSLSVGVDLFCTGILFLETGTRASKRLKTGQNRRAFDDGSGLAAQVTQLPRTSTHGHEYNASGVVLQFRARRAPVFGAEIPAVPAIVCATHTIAGASEQHVEWRPALLLAPPLFLTLLIQVEPLSWHPPHPCHPSTQRRFPRRSSPPVRSLPRAVTRRLGPL